MKKLILFTASTILVIITSCMFEKKKDTEFNETTFEKPELLGEWIGNKSEKNLKKDKVIIKKIDLKEDMTAQIEILDSTGHKTVNGNWKISEEQKLGSKNNSISFNSDISLTFDWSKTNRQIFMLNVKEHNKAKILTCNNVYFRKE
ncbi:hypothetical protein SAMN03080594_102410 [Arenibacter palladensis]|uniref:Lipocalin-like domain-containing protein n=2 Tax=Arenibacter palladensis TaxID=237373 RepID=A0A1M4YEQ1_9FLAO|nr:hypothetical protein SAMN03080594_102410 [Arenibacter palladensis]